MVVWLVVGGVVGEDGGAVEGAIVLGEVEPAFVANALWANAADADAKDVCGAVEEISSERDKRRVAHLFGERVDSHGADELVIRDCLAILESDYLFFGVDFLDSAMFSKLRLFFWQSLSHSNPDGPGASVCREAKCCVGAPIASRLL